MPTLISLGAPPSSEIRAATLIPSLRQAASSGTTWTLSLAGIGEASLSLQEKATWGMLASPAYQADFPFNAIALSWKAQTPPGSKIMFEVRAGPNGQEWTEWFETKPVDGYDAVDGEYRSQLIVARGRFIQYAATFHGLASGLPPILEEVRITYIDSSQGPPTPQPRTAGGFSREAGVTMPAVISRAGWGSPEPYSSERWPPEYQEWRKVIIHDTLTKNDDPGPAATVRAIWYYHANTLGWGDIGYNFLIDSYGNIYEGRMGGENVTGGHTLSCYNPGSIGIALLGDFRYAEVSPAMEEALISLLAAKTYQHDVEPLGTGYFGERTLPNIFCHRDVYGSCGNTHMDPGTYAHDRMAEFQQKVWERFPLYSQVWIDQSPPQRMAAGATASAAVIVKNGGRAIWSPSEKFRLGYRWYRQDGSEAFAAGNAFQRAELPLDIPFGQTVTINAKVTAPATGGVYTLKWDMVQEGVTWLSSQGNPTLNATVTVDEPTYIAEFVRQSGPVPLFPGDRKQAWFEVKNTGTATWYRNGFNPVLLGTWKPQDRSSALATNGVWPSPSRATLVDQDQVLPGQVARFTFTVSAPSQLGVYEEHFRLVAEGKTWFGPDMYLTFPAVRSIKTYLPEVFRSYPGGW